MDSKDWAFLSHLLNRILSYLRLYSIVSLNLHILTINLDYILYVYSWIRINCIMNFHSLCALDNFDNHRPQFRSLKLNGAQHDLNMKFENFRRGPALNPNVKKWLTIYQTDYCHFGIWLSHFINLPENMHLMQIYVVATGGRQDEWTITSCCN